MHAGQCMPHRLLEWHIAQQQADQQRHQHITGAGHVHRQVRAGPAIDCLSAHGQGHQLAGAAGHAMCKHPLRATRKQGACSDDGIVLFQTRQPGQATKLEGIGRHQPGMRQQPLGKHALQPGLHVRAGVGVANHRVQAIAQLWRLRQGLLQPVRKSLAIGQAAEVTGNKQACTLRQAALGRAQQ